jgi:glycosyltransferase EpsJ
MPIISVIVPVYRAESTLARCVDSILSQTFHDFELLLIDDGSPDQSGALCDSYAARDGRVRVFHKENDGVSSARNLGLYKAQGRYIAFADSDDWMEPDELDVLCRLVTRHDADAAGCAHNNVSPSGASQPEAGALPPGVYEGEALRAGLVDRLLGHRLEQPGQPVLNGYIWRFLFSRDIIAQCRILFDGAYLEDELFLVEYFSRSRRLAMTDRPLYNYLLNPDSAVHRYMAHYPDTFRSFLARKRALAQKLDADSRVPDWEDSTLWAGLLIAVSNIYAPGNPFTPAQQAREVRAVAEDPDFADVVSRFRPEGLSRNKAIVAALLRGRHYRLLTLLYRIKNRRK